MRSVWDVARRVLLMTHDHDVDSLLSLSYSQCVPIAVADWVCVGLCRT
jgi:hypothetical protein